VSMAANFVIPKIEREAVAQNYGKFVLSPLESGYGITLGNALRRVLLSSLEGAAVISVRITDVAHEFSSIPGVKEDVTQLLLQIKQLRVKLLAGDAARMRLEVSGEGTVTAADIIPPPEVEIINPDLYLFTVDDPKTKLDVEFTVQKGRGYIPSDEHGRMPIGELPIDAVFSPVRRVNFDVERARVGQDTNYDRLVLEVWTDGAIRPEEALSQSAKILIAHLRDLAGVSEESLSIGTSEAAAPKISSEILETPIEQLDLSVRVFNSLKRTGITTVGEVLDLLGKGEDAVLSIRNFGEKSLDELREKLTEKGFLRGGETALPTANPDME